MYFLGHGSREGSYCISLVGALCLEKEKKKEPDMHQQQPGYSPKLKKRCLPVLWAPSSSVVYPGMHFPISFKRGGGLISQNTPITLWSLNETTAGNKLHKLHRGTEDCAVALGHSLQLGEGDNNESWNDSFQFTIYDVFYKESVSIWYMWSLYISS